VHAGACGANVFLWSPCAELGPSNPLPALRLEVGRAPEPRIRIANRTAPH
jgi:hypothetical protein